MIRESAMIREKKVIIVHLVLLAVLFVVGVGLGFYIWGVERGEQPDYRPCLTKAAEHITTIEAANRELLKKTEALQKELADLNVTIKKGPDKLNEQITKLESQVASLTRERETAATITNKNKELTEQVNHLTEELRLLEGKNTALQSALEDRDDLTKEKERLEAELREAILERDALRQEIEQLQSGTGHYEAILEENKNCVKQARELEDQVKILKERLDAIQQLVTPEAGNGASGETPAESI
ncbi:MAG: hypothetical protein M0Q23_05135 [Syntrophales bacterium]|nr:hypothetical protein [Syntrophales bacterium]MCK9528025.1 hypothetical protein [Syntrophales bacterium]MDX9921398.1 hypothetical protein [Syntrophales bacterium]